ncbi:MAG: NAD-dependent epimerase/dehydratase family protein [Anaerolineales bacterium]
MKILVTGGAGFIGSHVVDAYLGAGHDVVGVDDLSTGRASNLSSAATFYQLDIRSPELEEVFQRERPLVVNHHAAQMDVRRSVREPIFDADVNISGSLNLLECARRFGVERFIYISTGGAVYGEPKYLPCDENHPINPICQYGASKHTVEHYLYMYRENYGLEYTVLRYPNVYGPRQDPRGEAGVVAIFAGQMLAGEELVINGDGEQERDFVYVADCARANLLALVNGNGSGIYNLGSGRGTTVNEIFEELKAITKYPQPAKYGPAKLGETRRIYLTAERAKQNLGWTPTTTLEEGLLKTVRSMREDISPQPIRVSTRSNGDAVVPSILTQDAEPGEQQILQGPHPDAVDTLYDDGQGLEDREGLLERLLKMATGAKHATSGSAFLLDSGGRLRDAAVIQNGTIWPTPDAAKCLLATYAKGLSGWTVVHRKAATVTDTAGDRRWMLQDWETESRSALCIPLVTGRQVVGALTVCGAGANAFSQADLALLVTIAGMFSLNGKEIAQSLDVPAVIPDVNLTEVQQEALQ